MLLAPGTRLGPYEIRSSLGAGSMGEVYRARDTRLGRDVALKVLGEHLLASPEARARFEREARAASGLNHPHICVLHDIGREGETDFLVMELIEGDLLTRRIARGPLPARETARLGAQIAGALGQAHRAGIVHRDLKPGNIMLTKTGAKLMDFGLARVAGADEPRPGRGRPTTEDFEPEPAGAEEPITRHGVVPGTLQYMSPEQIEGRDADARSDIWAVGCVLYEMATGRRAFEGASAGAVISGILHESPRPMRDLAPGVPPALERVVMHCLAKDPDERWQSAGDLARELDWLAENGAAPRAPAPGAATRWGTAGVARVLGAGGIVLALVSLYVAWHASHGAPRAFDFTRLTFHPMTIYTARFMPDGKAIVFSAGIDGGRRRILMKRPESLDLEPIGEPDTQLLSVSPTGELAVLTGVKDLRLTSSGTLARMPTVGEAPRELVEDVRAADWNADGSQLAIVRHTNAGDQIEYPIDHVLCRTAGWISRLRFSPAGNRIAFFDHPAPADTRGSVNLVDLQGRQKRLTGEYYALVGLAWSQDGDEVLFSASDGKSPVNVIAVGPNGRQRVVLETVDGEAIQDVDKDGRWLTTEDDYRSQVLVHRPGWMHDRAFSWLDESGFGRLSRNGKTLLFTEFGGPTDDYYAVCLKTLDDSPVTRLGDGAAYDISPDGKWALAGIPTQPPQLLVYPTGPGNPRQLIREGFDNIVMGWWFPDGDSVLFCGAETGHAPRFYVEPASGGVPHPVTPEGVGYGMPDRTRSAILAVGSGKRYFEYRLSGGPPRAAHGPSHGDLIGWWDSRTHRALITRDGKIPMPVQEVDLSTGRRTQVFEIEPPVREGLTAFSYVWFSDDRRTYIYTLEQVRSTLFLVEPRHS